MSSFHFKPIKMADTQIEVIEEILKEQKKQGLIKSKAEYELELRRMKEKINDGLPLMNVREQGTTAKDEITTATSDHGTHRNTQQSGVISSELHNQTFQELAFDLRSIFYQLNKLDENITKHQRLNQSTISSLKRRLELLENNIITHSALLDSEDMSLLYVEAFSDHSQVETDPSYYSDRDGRLLPISYRASFDQKNHSLKLPILTSENVLIDQNTTSFGDVKITHQLGSDLIHLRNKENDLSKILDEEEETFWAETILVDTPIEMKMDYYGHQIKRGATVELEVSFERLTEINELGFSIFGEYPLDLIAVYYFQGDHIDEKPQALIQPNATNPELSSRSVSSTTRYQFDNIKVKRVRLLFNQTHYVKSDILVSSKNRKQLKLWFDAQNVYKENEQAIDEALASYQSLISQEDHLKELLDLHHTDQIKALSKYEYNYGLYHLDLRKNEYHPVGMYVTKPIKANGNIRTLQLDTVETHPSVDHYGSITDIEYDIFDGEIWHPIVPIQQTSIKNERLFFSYQQSSYQAKARFHIKEGLRIFRDGQELDPSYYQLEEDQQTITIHQYNASLIYTASYVPNKTATTLDFLQIQSNEGHVVPFTKVEEFKGTDRYGSVTLEYHPFVDKDRLNRQSDTYNPTYLENETIENGYLPIKVRLVDQNGYQIHQPIDATDIKTNIVNKTNYFQPSFLQLHPFDESANIFYQYQVVGNQLFFNQPLPPETKIIVEYPYLVGDIRIKATLRRNAHNFYGMTPLLHQCALRFQTLM